MMAQPPLRKQCVMAYHHFRGKRSKVVVSPGVNPQYRETIRTYMQGYENFSMVGDATVLTRCAVRNALQP